jgi:DNA-binding protein HU-beta
MLDLHRRNLLYIRELPRQRQEVAVNRTELADAVAEKAGIEKKQGEAALAAVTETIIAEIKAGNAVRVFGFGTFEPKSRAARTARNPQTQATVKVAASKSVGFKPAQAFKNTLNTKGRAPAKKAAPAKAAATKRAAGATATAKKSTPRTAAKKAAPAKTTRAAKKR